MKAITGPFEEYKNNIKDFWQEEFLDYLLYRPLAFLVVKGTYSLPLVPNHFSILALITALVSGHCLASGTPEGFVGGGIGILLFGVWDCCDGMLARMKGNGGRYGEFVDMFVDILSAICFYGGLGWGLGTDTGWVFLSVASVCLHAGIYNFYKKQFVFYSARNPRGRLEEREGLERDLEILRREKGPLFHRFLIRSFLLFAGLQKGEEGLHLYNVEDYLRRNRVTLFLWGAIAGSGHLFFLALSTILLGIEFYFGFWLFFSNIWLLAALCVQWRVNVGTRAITA